MNKISAVSILWLLPVAITQQLAVQQGATNWLIVGNETVAYLLNRTTTAQPSYNTLTLPSILHDPGWQVYRQLLDTAILPPSTIPSIRNVLLPVVVHVDDKRLAFASSSQGVTIMNLETDEMQAYALDPEHTYLSEQASILRITMAADLLLAIMHEPRQAFVLVVYNVTSHTAIFVDYDTPTLQVAVRMVASPSYIALQATNASNNVSIATFQRISRIIVRLTNALRPIIAMDADVDLLLVADLDVDSNPRATLYLRDTQVFRQHLGIAHVALSSPYVLTANLTTVWIGQADLATASFTPLLAFVLHNEDTCIPEHASSCLQLSLLQRDVIISTARGMARLPWDTIQLLHVVDGVIRITTLDGQQLLLTATPAGTTMPTSSSTSTAKGKTSPRAKGRVSGTVMGVAVGLGLFAALALGLAVSQRQHRRRTAALLHYDEVGCYSSQLACHSHLKCSLIQTIRLLRMKARLP
jgi:hypothetical protein